MSCVGDFFVFFGVFFFILGHIACLFVFVYLCFFELWPYVLQVFLDRSVRGHAKCVAHGFRAALSNMPFLTRFVSQTKI